jgi:hypothetical protein
MGEKKTNLCSTRDQAAKLFTGRKLLTHACKILIFNLHQSNTSLLKCNGHCELYNIHRILVFRRAESGETRKKIPFPPEILVFNLIPLVTIYP